MRFYHSFYTDLPDQFVEANVERLRKWARTWDEKTPHFRKVMLVDGVALRCISDPKKTKWPSLCVESDLMIETWMGKKGDQYNGGYWGTLTEDQRSPDRVTRDAGQDDRTSIWTCASRAIYTTTNAATGLTSWSDQLEKPKPPLKREGIIAGEIVGYRCWRVKNGLLKSVYQSDVWKPGDVLEGRELGDWNQRGIHAWKDNGSKQYHDYIRGYLNLDPIFYLWWFGNNEKSDPRPAMVTGTVFLWGDVVEHERGWRAEYARVRSLDWLYPDAGMMGREEETLNHLRAKYRVLS